MTTDISEYLAARISQPFPAGEPRNRLLHGDCLALLPQMTAESVDLVLTDPPYIVRYQSRDGRSIPNDDTDEWLAPAFADMYRLLKPDSYRLHPTQKPLSVLLPLVESFSRPGDLVLDPFAGSGSTLVAARMLDRTYFGIEIDVVYGDIARKRLQQTHLYATKSTLESCPEREE